MKYIHSQESGRSMIEMLGVLAIIGVLSVGGIAGYSQAMAKFKVTKVTDQVQTMVTNIRTLFSSQRTYAAAGTANQLYAMGVLTDEMCANSDCTTATNPFGGIIKVASVKSPSGQENKSFAILYTGLPADVCSRIVMQEWGDASSGLVAIHAGNVAQSIADTDAIAEKGTGKSVFTSNHAGAMDLTEALAGCGSNGATSSIVWVYR